MSVATPHHREEGKNSRPLDRLSPSVNIESNIAIFSTKEDLERGKFYNCHCGWKGREWTNYELILVSRAERQSRWKDTENIVQSTQSGMLVMVVRLSGVIFQWWGDWGIFSADTETYLKFFTFLLNVIYQIVLTASHLTFFVWLERQLTSPQKIENSGWGVEDTLLK